MSHLLERVANQTAPAWPIVPTLRTNGQEVADTPTRWDGAAALSPPRIGTATL